MSPITREVTVDWILQEVDMVLCGVLWTRKWAFGLEVWHPRCEPDDGLYTGPKHVVAYYICICISLTYLLTYLLTPRSRVLLEKLASLQLVKKFPAFYGTRRFLTALTRARHLSLSWASPIQSSYPNPTSWRSVIHNTRHIFICTAVTRDSWCQFERLTSSNKVLITYFPTVLLCLEFCNKF